MQAGCLLHEHSFGQIEPISEQLGLFGSLLGRESHSVCIEVPIESDVPLNCG